MLNSMITDYGYKGPFPSDAPGIPARVTGAWGDYFRIVCDEGEGLARTKSSAFRDTPASSRPVAGDFVALQWNGAGESRILAVLPRLSVLQRADPNSEGREAQTIAANFDTVFYLTSANENFSIPRFKRFLDIATFSGCLDRVVALLTKVDLAPDKGASLLAQLQEAAPSIPACAISAKESYNLEALDAYAKPQKTLAFVGSSGVGKSSLVNALAGEFVADTCEIQEWSGKGRHTTTSRELLKLASGVLALDTPGLREFGTLDTTPDYKRRHSHCRRTSGHRYRM